VNDTTSTQLAPLRELGISTRDREYGGMLSVIDENRETVALALQHHGKSHTQFQYSLLDNAGPVAGPTKLRNMRQILAVIERTEAALQEAYFSRKEKDLDRQIAESKLVEEEDPLQRAKLELEIDKISSELARGESTIAGALRKLTAYYENYAHLESQMKKELDTEEITEAHFEADEERFHVMKAFEQALCAARSGGGRIDHGNFIYLHDIGVNGNCAQRDILEYLENEELAISGGKDVKYMHEMECAFLQCMAIKYKGCAVEYAKRKGLLAGLSSVATLGFEEQSSVVENENT
jgi:hypothetical protein